MIMSRCLNFKVWHIYCEGNKMCW